MAETYIYNVSIMHLDNKRKITDEYVVKQTQSYDEAVDTFIDLVKRDMKRSSSTNPAEILEEQEILNTVSYHLRYSEDRDNFNNSERYDGYGLTTEQLYDYEHNYIGPGRFTLEKERLQ